MDINSLAHTKWNCKYHIVFVPKYRRKVAYGKMKQDIAYTYGLRTPCKFKIQIWESPFLVQRILRRYSRKEQKGNRRIHKKPTYRRYSKRSNNTERVY